MQAQTPLLDYALCGPEDVQQLLIGQPMVGPHLETITQLINLFSEMVQGPSFLNRELAKKSRTEYFDVGAEYFSPLVKNCVRVKVLAPPFAKSADDPPVPTVQVWNSSERTYNSGSLLVLYDDYTVDVERGIIESVGGVWLSGPNAIKVTYTGGLVDPPGDQQSRPTAPADLRVAAAQQVAAWWQRRKDMNVDSLSFPQGGAISLSDPSKMLTSVKAVLGRYRVFRGVS